MNKRIIYCNFQARLVEIAFTLFYQQLKLTKVFNKKGYLYIYVNNTSMGKAVYFDDFKIIHKKFTFAKPLQLDDYYPFGMQTADSWVADNIDPNNYLFNASSELKETTNNYQTFFRDYDPALGRFFNVDPLSEDYYYNSPYAFSKNNVTSHIELEGLEKQPLPVHVSNNPSNPSVGLWTYAIDYLSDNFRKYYEGAYEYWTVDFRYKTSQKKGLMIEPAQEGNQKKGRAN